MAAKMRAPIDSWTSHLLRSLKWEAREAAHRPRSKKRKPMSPNSASYCCPSQARRRRAMASPTNETLVLLGPRVRAQAQRFRLSDRKRRVIEAILSLTFDCGIDTASIPRLRDLATLTRLDKSDLYKTVRALQLDGILQVIRNAGVARYCIP